MGALRAEKPEDVGLDAMTDSAAPITTATPDTRTVSVMVQPDHLERLSSARDPLIAIAELVWNGLDADAEDVSVELAENGLGGLQTITIIDDGHGLPYGDGLNAFRNLGGSLKLPGHRSARGRFQHGQLGKGRFRAFGLGSHVRWESTYRDGPTVLSYSITGNRENLGSFLFTSPQPTLQTPGMRVTIENLRASFRSLDLSVAPAALARIFALYLQQYPNVRIRYAGTLVDPVSAVDRMVDLPLEPATGDDGQTITVTLTVIEWQMPTERHIFLCDENGFAHGTTEVGIRASGFNFTAYLRSPYIRQLAESNALVLEELHEGLRNLVDAARDRLRAYFRERSAEAASVLVETWKKELIYPYPGQAANSVETIERKVFDILAVNVHAYLPDFDDVAQETKQLTFSLLRHAIQTNPRSLHLILGRVVQLSREKQDDLARLLERTSLDAIVAVSKLIADRLDFLAGLQALVLSPDLKPRVKERSQLHRLLAENTWIFGEEFNLTADDEDLTTVLRNQFADRTDFDLLDPSRPVVRADGRRAVIDLMLSRRIPMPRDEERQHLVIELKRPSVKIDEKAVSQVKTYAEAIATDARFRDTATRWVFWAVSTDIAESVRAEADQEGRDRGILSNPRSKPYTIWVKSWGEIIQENEGRLAYLKKRLQYRADEVSGLAYLQETYEKYIPSPSLVVDHDGDDQAASLPATEPDPPASEATEA